MFGLPLAKYCRKTGICVLSKFVIYTTAPTVHPPEFVAVFVVHFPYIKTNPNN